jgi:toxic protein SymE
MADANHKTVTPVTQRILTISSQRRPRPMKTFAPAHVKFFSRFAARALDSAFGEVVGGCGFEIGGRIRVEVQEGRLTTTPI